MISIRRNNFRLAYQSLRAAKGRSLLTMLGIIIGVMAVILVVCIGQGVKEQIAGQLGPLGKQVISIQPTSASSGVFTDLVTTSSLLTENDLRTVQQTSSVAYAAPLSTATGSMTGDHTVTSPFIVATNADFPKIIHQSMASGGFFDPEVDSKTVVLGESVAQKLFNDNAPLGQSLTWRGEQFVVAGVFNDFKAPPFSLEANFNNAVFVPYSTAQKISGNVLGLYQILARAKGSTDVTVRDTRAALKAAHGGSEDVKVQSASGGSTGSDQTIHLLTLLVTGAAVIALLVGGVGIMNVMLVSVTERMHEIGLRKAIGATNRQIMRQFVAEAFMLSSIGAIVGVAVACAAVGLLRAYSSLQPVLVWQILVLAPVLAIAIGLFFGSMPALKAARKDPIEALRQQ